MKLTGMSRPATLWRSTDSLIRYLLSALNVQGVHMFGDVWHS